MKNFTLKLLFIFSMMSGTSYCQQTFTFIPTETAFDFWVGEWDVHWFGQDSVKVVGSNYIEKTVGGRVIQEHFEDPSGFMGTSISILSIKDSLWHQTWADNQGRYLEFIGIIEADQKIFQTRPKEQDGEIKIQRMVFKNIQSDSFTWDWEGTRNGGETWNLLWRIHYNRKK